MPSLHDADFTHHLQEQLEFLYPEQDSVSLANEIIALFQDLNWTAVEPLWSEQDSLLITYGNTLLRESEAPLCTLRSFLNEYVGDAISMVHVLPFCPYSSDDGFSIIDYKTINPDLGDWGDLNRLADEYRLMGDLVINHISAKSDWFQNFLNAKEPGRGYFIECDPQQDYSQVVRPRASNLLSHVTTTEGEKHVWCTFSHDQVDLNFQNPKVLMEMLAVIRLYLDQGVRILRLDAIGFLWKKMGTSCIHLTETHAVVRLIRSIVDEFAPGTILISETNVPNKENLTYFGNCNEAHVIYNFSLAPLLIHALLTANSKHLRSWMMSMPPAPPKCTYLNFTASHDGLGMRPAEGLLTEEDQRQMIETVEKFGGRISRRRMSDGSERVYELNISLFELLKGTVAGEDEFQIERFLCSQTIAMGLEGIPAIYIHSLLATPNDKEGVERTGANRSINRHQWQMERLIENLEDTASDQQRVCNELVRRLRIRSLQSAFHPHATQFTLHLKSYLFGFWRQSQDRQQSIFAVHNLSNKERKLPLNDINLIDGEEWIDLISGQPLTSIYGKLTLTPYQCVWITNLNNTID